MAALLAWLGHRAGGSRRRAGVMLMAHFVHCATPSPMDGRHWIRRPGHSTPWPGALGVSRKSPFLALLLDAHRTERQPPSGWSWSARRCRHPRTKLRLVSGFPGVERVKKRGPSAAETRPSPRSVPLRRYTRATDRARARLLSAEVVLGLLLSSSSPLLLHRSFVLRAVPCGQNMYKTKPSYLGTQPSALRARPRPPSCRPGSYARLKHLKHDEGH